ncbi:ADP-ribosylation factor GTPase-activating protein gcs1 [Paramarasmius palmivorus]|uniref:ADP-ribosylation factor GTPase-activating protein gcs1 n=1 Tax=Paramarasmius palmivorus TaxID=297713 RepID=A0AAW0EAJ2_9AGAR
MDHKKILMELSKRDDLKNKGFIKLCYFPLSTMCRDSSGQILGFGVHVSFVRSISMDTWQDEQVKRMQARGNGPFRDFMRSYAPAEQGGYSDSLSSYDTYHCWAATQYREKLDAELAGKPWSPSAPPPGFTGGSGSSTPERPSSAQGLRKSRTTTRGSTLRSDSASPSPASFQTSNSPSGTPLDQKTANETYFASLGQLNASRPDNLPPSQGGKYQGFGNTPSPPPNSEHPSYGLSSRAAPSFNDFQENPMGALSKGWSLFSTAVAGASKVVNDNIVRPGMERVNDPNFQASVKGYLTEAQKRATEAGSTANQWGKKQFGVDVAGSVGGVMRGDPQRNGYGSVPTEHEETSALYQDDDDFFQDWNEKREEQQKAQSLSMNSGAATSSSSSSATAQKAPAAAKKNDWDDEWKDF